jgi:hypothetical protein
MTENNNPYAAPESDVTPPMATPHSGNFELLAEPRKVSMGAGAGWIKEAWQAFKPNWSTWVLLMVLFVVAAIVFTWLLMALGGASMFVLLGEGASSEAINGAALGGLAFAFIAIIILTLITPVIYAGMIKMAKDSDDGKDIKLSDVFHGFSSKFKPLLALGAISLAVSVVIEIITALLGQEGLGVAVNFILSIVSGLYFYYATHLIAVSDVPVIESLKRSFSGALKNIPALFVYIVLSVVLVILGAIPVGLGMLVVLPVLTIAHYISYKQIYLS